MFKQSLSSNLLITFLVSIFIFHCDAFSATLFLKNGHEIKAQNISDIGEKYRCHIKSGITLEISKEDVDHVETEENQRKKLRQSVSVSPFNYDIWDSGIDINQAISIARENDIPLTRNGYCSSSKHYNPKDIEPYVKTFHSFSYRSNILGRNCSVELYFTPKSRLLYQIKIVWISPKNLKQFLNEIEYILDSKYDCKSSLKVGFMHETRTWNLGINIKIILDYLIGGAALYYVDKQITLVKDKEQQKIYNQKKKAYLDKDRQKF